MGSGHEISKGNEERACENSRGQLKKMEFPAGSGMIKIKSWWWVSMGFIFGLGISKGLSHNFAEFSGGSFVFSGISKGKVTILKITS